MIKLMKYEFRKQAFSKGIILAILGLVELVFLYGIIFDKEKTLAVSIVLLTMLMYASVFFVAFESIFTFSNDLKTKRSYMLFLTPRSSYQIIGAKVISAGIQVLVVGFLFILVGIGDIMLLITKYDKLAELRDMIEQFVKQMTNINIFDIKMILLVFLMLLLSWVSIITIAFFSITLSTTFLANKKFKGFVSFVIFVGINFLFNFIVNKTIGIKLDESNIIYNCLYTLCFTAITFFGTAWMLEKKVCV